MVGVTDSFMSETTFESIVYFSVVTGSIVDKINLEQLFQEVSKDWPPRWLLLAMNGIIRNKSFPTQPFV